MSIEADMFQPPSNAFHDRFHLARHHHKTYNGHRRRSFRQDDVDELVELRARQRTFDGAYVRAALGNLGYALIILQVFSVEFAKIGLIYVVLAVLLLLISFYRGRRSDHDFADIYRPVYTIVPNDPTSALAPVGPRLWGRPFRTSGDFVVLVGMVVTGLYLALFIFVMKL